MIRIDGHDPLCSKDPCMCDFIDTVRADHNHRIWRDTHHRVHIDTTADDLFMELTNER
jgi:hypothetical protein